MPNIFRFDIAMNNLAVVSVLQGAGNVLNGVHHLGEGQSRAMRVTLA